MVDDWRARANCKGVPVEVFFHPDGERDPVRSRREARAKAICRGCPVQLECLHEAVATPNPYGTWGGMSERERRRFDDNEYRRLQAVGVRPGAAAALAARPAPVAPVTAEVEVRCAS